MGDNKLKKSWWKEVIAYQIYPRSFFDSNNDGCGDINGIIEKLDYLKDLSIDLVWISPFYDSPMDDNGYDIRDYYQVAKQFGTLVDVKNLIKEAHKRNIKVMFDLVLNHTSDEHPWFIEARKSRDNDYRDYYIWLDGRVINGKMLPPTNWGSFFGGSCFEYDEVANQYYMKIFGKKQPDLNWKNKKVREEMKKIINWWIDQGVDGFRVDAISHLGKAEFIDAEPKSKQLVYDFTKFSNLELVHEVLKELGEEIFFKRNVATIGEVGGSPTVEEAFRYIASSNKELNMLFTFDHVYCNENGKVDFKKLKEAIFKWQEAIQNDGWIGLYWANHDHPRVLSYYGDEQNPIKSASMLATLMYFLKGTPFIYNGEEIGMTNYPFTSISDFDDVKIRNNYEIEVLKGDLTEQAFIDKYKFTSRDNARTVFQWNKKDYAGFSTVLPKYKVNPNYLLYNVEKELQDTESILKHYKAILKLRKEYQDIFVYGSTNIKLRDHEQIVMYERKFADTCIVVICNFFNSSININIDYEKLTILYSNYNEREIIKNHTLKPYEAIVLKVEGL